jgi:putative DNA primase/helicase
MSHSPSILGLLQRVSKSGKGWRALCPAHDDHNPSLSVLLDQGGGVHFKCFAGCPDAAIREALGVATRSCSNDFRQHGHASLNGRLIEASYPYVDEKGRLLFEVVRFRPKDFRQRQPDGRGGWTWNLKGVRLVPFRLDKVAGADPSLPVFIVEGEKDVLSLEANGLLATCNPGGAGKWRSQFAEYFRGRDIVILPDNDLPGESHSKQVAGLLSVVSRSIKIVQLPGLSPKGDVSDWFSGGGTADNLLELCRSVAMTCSSKPNVAAAEETKAELESIIEDKGRTDLANARRFVAQFGDELVYVPAWKRWLSWDGRRWADDHEIGARRLANEYARGLWQWLAKFGEQGIGRDELGTVATFFRQSNKLQGIQAFLRLAESDSRVVCQADQLNSNPCLLNLLNGTLDLESGQLRKHSREDRLTQLEMVEFHPKAICPEWEATIDLIFDGDKELQQFVQRILGYSIAGLTSEHILPICWGDGCNGKSTIWNAMVMLLGDYALLANQELLLPARSEHPTAKASLFQKRFVAISEPSQGRALDEAKVKELTGDEIITARRMYENFWSFRATHTFWLSTNHRPKIRGSDEGIWRRIKLIPFTVDLRKRTEIKKDFARSLVAKEGPGILNWLIKGYQQWRQFGLDEPNSVKEATTTYRQDEDVVTRFITEHCVVAGKCSVVASDLFRAFESQGGRLSQTVFGMRVAERFPKVRAHSGPHRNKLIYEGLGLLSQQSEEPRVAQGCAEYC